MPVNVNFKVALANLTPEQRAALDKYKAGEPLTEEERKVRFPGMVAERKKA